MMLLFSAVLLAMGAKRKDTAAPASARPNQDVIAKHLLPGRSFAFSITVTPSATQDHVKVKGAKLAANCDELHTLVRNGQTVPIGALSQQACCWLNCSG